MPRRKPRTFGSFVLNTSRDATDQVGHIVAKARAPFKPCTGYVARPVAGPAGLFVLLCLNAIAAFVGHVASQIDAQLPETAHLDLTIAKGNIFMPGTGLEYIGLMGTLILTFDSGLPVDFDVSAEILSLSNALTLPCWVGAAVSAGLPDVLPRRAGAVCRATRRDDVPGGLDRQGFRDDDDLRGV